MELYTDTLTTTFANLATALSSMTANTSITILDPENIVIGNSGTSGTLGYIIKAYSNTGRYLVDLSPTDLSSAQYTSGATSLFRACTKLSGIGKLPLGITDATYMFLNCSALTSVDTTSFTNVNNTSGMFYSCTSLTSVDTTPFTKVTSASSMFSSCTSLTSVDTASFTNVISASSMFQNCPKLTSIDTTAFTKVINADYMFSSCTSLTSIDTTAFTKVINANEMFYGCTGLTSIDTTAFTQVINANEMFYGCTGLTSIDTPPVFTKLMDATSMFYGCTGLTSINASAFTNVVTADDMFYGCTGLTSIDISSMTSLTDTSTMFMSSGVKVMNCGSNSISSLTTYTNMLASTPITKLRITTSAAYNAWYTIVYTNHSTAGLSLPLTPTYSTIIYKRIA